MHVVCGHKSDVAPALGLLRDVETGQQRHLDVEKQYIGRVPLDQIQRFDASPGLTNYAQCRPQLAKVLTQFIA
jgi:hypothetical protein